MDKKKTIKVAFIDTLPIILSYMVLSIGFGILMADAGYSFIWAMLMTVFIYAGSMQFVMLSMFTSGASLVAAGLMTLMINARQFFYGISMLGKYREIGRGKYYLIFGCTDETYSLVCTDRHDEEWFHKKTYYLAVTTFNYMTCIIFCGLGAFIGKFIPFDTTGIDFAMTALFTVVFIDQWLSTKDHKSAIIGVCSALGCLLVFGPDSFLIPTMLLITAVLLLLRRREKCGKITY